MVVYQQELLAEPVQVHSLGGRVHPVQSKALNIDVDSAGGTLMAELPGEQHGPVLMQPLCQSSVCKPLPASPRQYGVRLTHTSHLLLKVTAVIVRKRRDLVIQEPSWRLYSGRNNVIPFCSRQA